nr:hypothetical protein [Tanacetum cinerariifolium]
MGDEHLNTILATKSNEFIKSCVKNLVPNPSESEGESECDMPASEAFTTFSNVLFDADYDFYYRLLYDNSSPRPPEEFVSKNSNADIECFSPSPIPIEDSDSRMEEIDLTFTLDDPMPPGIEEDDYDSERDILILEELLDKYSLSLHENESYHFDIPSSSRPPARPPDVTPTEPIDSLSMGDEHLNTISATESDEFIKSCVENLVPNPSESEGENGCDVPAGFTTFSNIIFDDDYDSDSSDDQSLSIE